MKKKPKIFMDREKLIFQYSKEPGSMQRVDTYLTTRAGISWPSPNSPGYYCILGLKDESTLTEKRPLVLLAEGEDELMEKFFERLSVTANRLFCNRIFANLEHNKGFEDSLFKFVRQRKLEGIRPWDSSEFEDFDHGVSLIRQYKRNNALIISEKSILLTQIQSMTPDDLSEKFESRFYAVAALCRVLGSFEAYPWYSPRSGTISFGNFDDRNKSDWDGSYQEMNF
jgi:hypothetical protein